LVIEPGGSDHQVINLVGIHWTYCSAAKSRKTRIVGSCHVAIVLYCIIVTLSMHAIVAIRALCEFAVTDHNDTIAHNQLDGKMGQLTSRKTCTLDQGLRAGERRPGQRAAFPQAQLCDTSPARHSGTQPPAPYCAAWRNVPLLTDAEPPDLSSDLSWQRPSLRSGALPSA
jgi:hypothetical protein